MKTTIIYPDKKPEGSPEDHAEMMRRSIECPHGPGSPKVTVVNRNKVVGENEDDVLKNPHKYSTDDYMKHYQDVHGRKVN